MPLSFLKKRTDTFDYALSRICKNCENTFSGRFCNRCGEKVFEPSERSIANFLGGLLNAFTFLDGKFVKTLKLLFTKPGKLSRNIADGHQVPFMKMLSLFFVANFFYFLFPLFDAFNSSLHTQMNVLGHSEKATRIVNEVLIKDHISLEDFTAKYEAASTNISKLMIILLVIMFSLLLSIVNYSRKVYYYEHLLFSLEYYSFHILTILLIIPYAILLPIRLSAANGMDLRWLLSDEFYFYPMILIIGYYIIKGQLNFYFQKWYWAIPKTLLLLLLIRETWDIYRRGLFYMTMWWIG